MARIAPAFAGVPTCCMQVGRYSIGGKRVVAAPGCWMVLLIITLGLAADASFGGDASAAASDPVQERGLQHAQTGLELVEKAVASTNLVARGTGMRLVMSAQGGKLNSRTSPTDIPVYLVKAPPMARTTPAAVPKGCRCLFVNPDVFNAFIREQSTGDGRLGLNARYVLTFMLLHEVGHLAKKTTGAEFENGNLSELNIDPSLAKASEEDADEFAADLIKALMQRKKASDETLEATAVSMELSKLSWNMQAYRTLDQFGALAVGKPEVFFDKNLSHPNLHWRVLRMNHLIQGSSDTKMLLDTFEDARRRGANPEPLYDPSKK